MACACCLLVSVQSLRSTRRAESSPFVAHHSFTDRGKRFASLGGCYASVLFVGSDTTVSQFVELCDAQAESVTRRRTMGARGEVGSANYHSSKNHANYSGSTHLRLHGRPVERLKHLTQYDGSGCGAEARRIAYGAFKRP